MNENSHILRQRFALLRRVLPLALVLLVVFNQLGLLRWIQDTFGYPTYSTVETVFYASVGPLAAYWVLRQIDRWLAEKEQAEELARASERRLASIANASADAILSLNAQGRIASWNRGAELIFGYSAQEMQGRPLLDLFGGREAAEIEFHWLVEGVRQERFVRGHKTTCWDATGQQITVELTATDLTDEAEQDLSMSIILRDITARQRREAEIRRLNASLREQVAERTHELAEKVEELAKANAELQKLDRTRSEFVSLVSHQLRAPLTNVHGALEHIEANCPAMDATCLRMLPILNEQVERLDRLVGEVLNMTRIESGGLVLYPEPVSVLPMLQQVVEQVRVRRGERPFSLPTKPGLPLVFADPDQVVEVLVNLLDNADKYSPPGKEVIIDARADQTEVTLSVRDFGPGLSTPDVERIFDKFYRTDSSDSQSVYGYGLGLYICRRLVEAQGGRIWAENHPNGGAIFSIALPVAI
jgi:PAS domain S-box-containing protein